MEYKELLAKFASLEDVPVDVQDDLVPVIKANYAIELYFFPSKIDTGVYRGQIAHWEYPMDGVTHQVVDITYADSLSTRWQRLVCAKELIHILDPVDYRVSTDEGVRRLIEKIALPPGMTDMSDGEKVWNDRNGIFYALALLFPWATRQLFMEPYKAKKLTIEEIADKVDLPRQYVALVMDALWERVHHLINA